MCHRELGTDADLETGQKTRDERNRLKSCCLSRGLQNDIIAMAIGGLWRISLIPYYHNNTLVQC